MGLGVCLRSSAFVQDLSPCSLLFCLPFGKSGLGRGQRRKLVHRDRAQGRFTKQEWELL